MKRYEKIVLKAEKGITLKVSEGTSGELIIRALNIATDNVYSENNIETTNVGFNLQAVSAGEYAEVLSVYTDNDGNKMEIKL